MSGNKKINKFKCEECNKIFDTEPEHIHFDPTTHQIETWCERCWEDHHEFPLSDRTFKFRNSRTKYVFDHEKPHIEEILKNGVPAWEDAANIKWLFDEYYHGDEPDGWVVFYKIGIQACTVSYVSYDEMFRLIELRILKEEWHDRDELKTLFQFYRRFEFVDDRWSSEATELLKEVCEDFQHELTKRYKE